MTHTYHFDVRVDAASRDDAETRMYLLTDGARDEVVTHNDHDVVTRVTWSAHTAHLVYAIEERAELDALRGLLEMHPETSSSRDDDRADAYEELLGSIRARIDELENA